MILASDLHFGENEPADIEQLREAVLADPDQLLVLAGDLTQNYEEDEFKAAGRFVGGLLAAGVTIVCTPGNHDYGRWRGEIRSNQAARRLYEYHILDPVRRQRGVVKSGDADLILRHGADVFVALRSTHAHALKGPRIRSEQLDWATKALDAQQGSKGDRYHLVTHHSLWPPPPVARHGPQTERERLERRLLLPYGFQTVVTGHLHAFECRVKQTPKLDLDVLHVGVPTMSTRERGARGYVRWMAPEMPALVALTTEAD